MESTSRTSSPSDAEAPLAARAKMARTVTATNILLFILVLLSIPWGTRPASFLWTRPSTSHREPLPPGKRRAAIPCCCRNALSPLSANEKPELADRQDATKPKKVIPEFRAEPHPRRAAAKLTAVAPRAATQHAILPRNRPCRVRLLSRGILTVPICHPLPHVARHIQCPAPTGPRWEAPHCHCVSIDTIRSPVRLLAPIV